MDPVYLIWLFAIGALVGGGIIGAIAYRNLAPSVKDASHLKAELDQVRQELDSYKASVNSHFDKTSELVNELTQDYVKVYKHLAEGAQALGDTEDFTHVLEQHQGKILIAVDADPGAQDPIVSEQPAEAQPSPEASRSSPELSAEEGSREKIPGGNPDVATEVLVSDSPEVLVAQGDKKEPLLDVEASVPNGAESVNVAQPEESIGNEGSEESLAAKPVLEEKTAQSPRSKTDADTAKTA